MKLSSIVLNLKYKREIELPYLMSQVSKGFSGPVSIYICLKCYVLCSFLFFTSMANNLSDTEYFE